MKIITIKDLKQNVIFDVSEQKWLTDYKNRLDEDGNTKFELISEQEDENHNFVLPYTYQQNITIAKSNKTTKCCGK